MNLFKKTAMVGCILFLVVTVACAKNQIQSGEATPTKIAETDDKVEGKTPTAARTVEEMIEQKAGLLIEEHMDQRLETLESWDRQQYLDFIEQTFNPIAEKEFKAYFSKHNNLTSEQIYDYLVYMLGSENYKSYYEKLAAYDHGYVMPELPDGEDKVTSGQKKLNILVLMDASGSMNEIIEGRTKLEQSKDSISEFAKSLPEDANVSLIAYGHVGSSANSDKVESCSSVEEVYPLSSYQADNFTTSLKSFQASGWTPLAVSIKKAGEILQTYPSDEYYNMIYIVSDGIETCDGDPVAEAQKLQSHNIKAKVNIIGFSVDNEGQQQLKQVADSGGGEYITVDDPAELEVKMNKEWKPTLGQLVWTQGVTLQQTVEAMERMNEIYNPLYYASSAELNRIKHAVYYLKKEKLINDDVKNQVLEIAESSEDMRKNHFSEIKKAKELDRERTKEEINAKVEEWRQQWQ